MNDDVKALVDKLIGWCTDWDGSAMVRAEPPRDGLHCDDLLDAARALTAQAEEIERLRDILTFDCTGYPDMEAAAIKWANKISGPKGGAHFHPDPVILLEICEDIASAALKAAQEVKA